VLFVPGALPHKGADSGRAQRAHHVAGLGGLAQTKPDQSPPGTRIAMRVVPAACALVQARVNLSSVADWMSGVVTGVVQFVFSLWWQVGCEQTHHTPEDFGYRVLWWIYTHYMCSNMKLQVDLHRPAFIQVVVKLPWSGVDNGRSVPARVDVIRMASNEGVGVVAGKIASWQLRGASNPVTSRGDVAEHGCLGLVQVADIREHLYRNKVITSQMYKEKRNDKRDTEHWCVWLRSNAFRSTLMGKWLLAIVFYTDRPDVSESSKNVGAAVRWHSWSGWDSALYGEKITQNFKSAWNLFFSIWRQNADFFRRNFLPWQRFLICLGHQKAIFPSILAILALLQLPWDIERLAVKFVLLLSSSHGTFNKPSFTPSTTAIQICHVTMILTFCYDVSARIILQPFQVRSSPILHQTTIGQTKNDAPSHPSQHALPRSHCQLWCQRLSNA
jgi:hypothetical protein